MEKGEGGRGEGRGSHAAEGRSLELFVAAKQHERLEDADEAHGCEFDSEARVKHERPSEEVEKDRESAEIALTVV